MKLCERTVRMGTGMDAMIESMPFCDYIPVDSAHRTTAANRHCICPHLIGHHCNCRNVVGNVYVDLYTYNSCMYCSDERETVSTAGQHGSNPCYTTLQVLPSEVMVKDSIPTGQANFTTFRNAHRAFISSTISIEWLAPLSCLLTLPQ